MTQVTASDVSASHSVLKSKLVTFRPPAVWQHHQAWRCGSGDLWVSLAALAHLNGDSEAGAPQSRQGQLRRGGAGADEWEQHRGRHRGAAQRQAEEFSAGTGRGVLRGDRQGGTAQGQAGGCSAGTGRGA